MEIDYIYIPEINDLINEHAGYEWIGDA